MLSCLVTRNRMRGSACFPLWRLHRFQLRRPKLNAQPTSTADHVNSAVRYEYAVKQYSDLLQDLSDACALHAAFPIPFHSIPSIPAHPSNYRLPKSNVSMKRDCTCVAAWHNACNFGLTARLVKPRSLRETIIVSLRRISSFLAPF